MRETGSGETKLANYGSDLDSYSPEHHIYTGIINNRDQDALSKHDPNETLDQISEDDLTVNALQVEDEAKRTAQRRMNGGPSAKFEQPIFIALDLNREFDNVADPIFDTPTAAMAEATIHLMQMPGNAETECITQLTCNVVT